MNLKENIEAAKKSIRELKLHAPWLLIEHSALLDARVELRRAQKKYRAALKSWNNLGNK